MILLLLLSFLSISQNIFAEKSSLTFHIHLGGPTQENFSFSNDRYNQKLKVKSNPVINQIDPPYSVVKKIDNKKEIVPSESMKNLFSEKFFLSRKSFFALGIILGSFGISYYKVYGIVFISWIFMKLKNKYEGLKDKKENLK